MPVGIGMGIGRGEPLRPGAPQDSRFAGPEGYHPGALRIAAATLVLATLLLLGRLAV